MFKGFVLNTLVNVLILRSSLLTITFIKLHFYANFSFDWTLFIFELLIVQQVHVEPLFQWEGSNNLTNL